MKLRPHIKHGGRKEGSKTDLARVMKSAVTFKREEEKRRPQVIALLGGGGEDKGHEIMQVGRESWEGGKDNNRETHQSIRKCASKRRGKEGERERTYVM